MPSLANGCYFKFILKLVILNAPYGTRKKGPVGKRKKGRPFIIDWEKIQRK